MNTLDIPPGRRGRLALKIALLASGVYLTNHLWLNQLAHLLNLGLWHWLAVFCMIWASAVAALLYVAFMSRRGARVVWAVLLSLSTLIGEVHFAVVGDWLSLARLDAMWDPALASVDTVAFYGRQVGRALLETAVLMAGLLIPLPLPVMPRVRALPWLPLAPFVLIGALTVYDAGSSGLETRALPSQFHSMTVLALYPLSTPPPTEMTPVDIPLVAAPAARHVVLIVDESVSGDFIDVNVDRGTTPYLRAHSAGFVNFGLATSASTCSNASNAILRLGARPELLGTGNYSPLSNPSIWSHAKRAGFTTNFIDAQRLARHHQHFMFPAELRLIDHVLTPPPRTRLPQKDVEVQHLLRVVLTRPTPQFVYINKEGAHFPYQLRTPLSEAPFQPSMGPREPMGDRARLVNAYKNVIRWSVDHFFETLLPNLDLSNTVIIYTSDHGQNLLDDGTPVTHCRRMGVQVQEAVVPLLVWTGNAALHERFQQSATMNVGAASHFEVFPTVLELFGYDPDSVRSRYHQSLFERIDTPMGFISGPVTNRFGRKPVWHPRDGLHQMTR